MSLTDEIRRLLEREDDLMEVPIKIRFNTSWAKEEFLDKVQMMGDGWVHFSGDEGPGGRSTNIGYSKLLSLLGIDEQMLKSKLKRGTNISEFFVAIKEGITHFWDKEEKGVASTALYPPVIYALDEPLISQKFQIEAIEKDEIIYYE